MRIALYPARAAFALLVGFTSIASADPIQQPAGELTGSRFDAYLKHVRATTPLSGSDFVGNGLSFNVDPRLVAGIAFAETQLGTDGSACTFVNNPFNFFKCLSAGTCTSSDSPSVKCQKSAFGSWTEAIHFVTKNFRTSPLYWAAKKLKPLTIEAIGDTYCCAKRGCAAPDVCTPDPSAGCCPWAGNVGKIYDWTLDDPASTPLPGNRSDLGFNCGNGTCDVIGVGANNTVPQFDRELCDPEHSCPGACQIDCCGAGACGVASCLITPAQCGSCDAEAFACTHSMTAPRSRHAAAPLQDGRILLAGGVRTVDGAYHILDDTELFDPATANFTSVGSMMAPREYFQATPLADGSVLITGGLSPSLTNAAEIFDPATHTFHEIASMSEARYRHTATLLLDGRVLIAGGGTSGASTSNTAEMFDPASATFSSPTSGLGYREAHTATLLKDGRVLIAGGIGWVGDNTTTLFDPAAETFTKAGNMSVARGWHTATLLIDGRVLVTGGTNGGSVSWNTAEIFDPATGTFSQTGSMHTGRYNHTATRLVDGRVLIVGGFDVGVGYLTSAELYDPSTGTFSMTRDTELSRFEHTANLLPNGAVLVAGGRNPVVETTPQAATDTAEEYQP